MKDMCEVLHELVGADLMLRVTQQYVMKRDDWGFDIEVCRFVNGDSAGKFVAIPKLAWKVAAHMYFGHGNSDDEALRACLKKITARKIRSDVS